MKISIDFKKELFRWGPIDFLFFYGSVYIEVIFKLVKKHYPWSWPSGLVCIQKGKLLWIIEQPSLESVGEKYFQKYFLNLNNYKKHWQRWEEWVKMYNQEEAGYLAVDWSRIDGQKLLGLFRKFHKLLKDFWIIAHVPEIANYGGEAILRRKLAQLGAEKADEYLEILSAPVKLSFFQQEESDLIKIYPARKNKNFKKLLAAHAQKYYWLLNSYGGNQVLDSRYFERKIKDITRNKGADELRKSINCSWRRNKNRKKSLAKKLHLPKELVLTAEQLSQSIWWQDARKSYIWRSHYVWDKILREMAKRSGWKFKDLLWCWPREIIGLMKGERVNKKRILSRRQNYVLFGQPGAITEFFGNSAQKIYRSYLSAADKEIYANEIKGLAVSRGNQPSVKGIVKIIRNPFKEFAKMKSGDILVTGMTSPEFIIVMREAAAIITDTGGMTSHAAIVSRELQKPCIVGTKIATKVFKDGDRVEVDAKNGIVRKL